MASQRPCHGCHQVDDHPRHHHVIDLGDATQDELHHFDCHASLGCESCAQQIADTEGRTGDELRAHLTRTGV